MEDVHRIIVILREAQAKSQNLIDPATDAQGDIRARRVTGLVVRINLV